MRQALFTAAEPSAIQHLNRVANMQHFSSLPWIKNWSKNTFFVLFNVASSNRVRRSPFPWHTCLYFLEAQDPSPHSSPNGARKITVSSVLDQLAGCNRLHRTRIIHLLFKLRCLGYPTPRLLTMHAYDAMRFSGLDYPEDQLFRAILPILTQSSASPCTLCRI